MFSVISYCDYVALIVVDFHTVIDVYNDVPLTSLVCHQEGCWRFVGEGTSLKLASRDGKPTSFRPWFLAELQSMASYMTQ